MHDLEPMADLAGRFCEAILDGGGRNLEQRVASLVELVPSLYVAGQVLPPVPDIPSPPSGPGAAAWPGLGRFDDEEPLSERLLGVEAWMWSGLQYWQEGDLAGAVTVWGGGWARWSTALAEVLPGLHRAALRFRPVPELPRARERAAGVVMLGPQEAKPMHLAAPPKAQKPALGVRFEAIGLGAWVREVHPKGPAAGKLDAGDVVISVDGLSLEHVDPNVLAARMVGEVGRERVYEVYREGSTREERFAAVDAGELMRG